MFEGVSPSFCRSSKQLWNGGNPKGKEFGCPFLHTLLWHDKRVWRRAGPQPRDLVVCIFLLGKELKIRTVKLMSEREEKITTFAAL